MSWLEKIRAKITAAPLDTKDYDWSIALHPDDFKELLAELAASNTPAESKEDSPWKGSIRCPECDNDQFADIFASDFSDRGSIRLLRRAKSSRE